MIASDVGQMWLAVFFGMLTAVVALLAYYVSQTLRYRNNIWGFFAFRGFVIGIMFFIISVYKLYLDEYAMISDSARDSCFLVYGALSVGLFIILLYPVSIVGKRLGHFDQAELDRRTKSPEGRRDILSKYGVKNNEGERRR